HGSLRKTTKSSSARTLSRLKSWLPRRASLTNSFRLEPPMRRVSRHRFLRQCACLLSGTTAVGLSMAIAEDAKIDLQVRCLSATCSGGGLKARIRITNRSPFAIEFLAAGMTCPGEDCAMEVVDKEGNVVFKETGSTENGGGPSEVIRLPPRGFFETT